MGRGLVGMLVGMLVMSPWVDAFRVTSPPTITEWTPSTIAQLNTYLQALWQITNGRYTIDVTTTNPNGSRVGTRGDLVAYLNGSNWKFCLNTTATTAASPTGTTWRCNTNALTAP